MAERLESVVKEIGGLRLPLGAEEIATLIPHRYPFLFVDRVTELEPGLRAVGYKNVSINEGFFGGHIPGAPLMPGVLVVEALAQMSGIVLSSEQLTGAGGNGSAAGFTFAFLAGVKRFRFKGQIRPGDQLVLESRIANKHRNISEFDTRAMVNGSVVGDGTITFAAGFFGG